MRIDLLRAMLATLEESGVDVQYNMSIESVATEHEQISAKFENGTTVTGDILLGCDGIHSAIRTKFIQPDRTPEYTGVAVTYGFLDSSDLAQPLPIKTTTLFSGRLGSMLLSHIDTAKSRLYVSAVLGVDDVGSRQGWTAKGSDQDALQKDLMKRFSNESLPLLGDILRKIESIVLYPVYRLSDNGNWTSGRMLLLGDAAHAVSVKWNRHHVLNYVLIGCRCRLKGRAWAWH